MDRKVKKVYSGMGSSGRGWALGKDEYGIWWMYFVFIYENRRMKPVEIVLRKVGGGGGRPMEGVNLTKYIYKQCLPLYNYYILLCKK
jgi:hypothetical protein